MNFDSNLMYFVLAQIRDGNRTYDYNIRLGGYRHHTNAVAAAKRHSKADDLPYLVKDHTRALIGMANCGVFTNV
jgi:hypothetical protein